MLNTGQIKTYFKFNVSKVQNTLATLLIRFLNFTSHIIARHGIIAFNDSLRIIFNRTEQNILHGCDFIAMKPCESNYDLSTIYLHGQKI